MVCTCSINLTQSSDTECSMVKHSKKCLTKGSDIVQNDVLVEEL